MNFPPLVSKTLVKTLGTTRAALYFSESLPLSLVARLITGKDRNEFRDPEKLKSLVAKIQDMIDRDAELFAQGVLPLELLKVSTPIDHFRSFLDVFVDAIFVARRMKHNTKSDLPKESIEDLPEYYRRNFHFQSDGYLSRKSARRYNHQVDILFSGTTDMMRRMTLKPELPRKDEKLKILELACGVGSTTKQWATTFKNSRIFATDLSKEYLSHAKKSLRGHANVDFIRTNATELPFKSGEFDVVYHVYLFHELPLKARKDVMQESLRVLKKGGSLIVADSLQLGDDPSADWALKEFPKTYHEPFYPNYIRSSLEKLFEEFGLRNVQTEIGFLTKCVSGTK